MKPSLVSKTLETLVTARQPAMIWGPPGVGKSVGVQALAKRMGVELIDIRALLLDPVDLRGVPFIDNGVAYWAPGSFLPRQDCTKKGILFLDELTAAPPSTQAACYQLVLDRKLGEYRLPDGWQILAAGNRMKDRSVANKMPAALANRFVHLEYEVDLEDWITWAIDNGIEPEIVAFIRFRPALLHDFVPNANAFATPRSWEFASRTLKSLTSENEMEVLSGTIGEGVAAEFVAFLRVWRHLPNPDLIIMNPDSAEVPSDPATRYALCGALAHRATDQTFERIVKYTYRLPPEFQVLLIRDAVRRDNTLTNTKVFNEWVSKNKDVLF